MARFHMRTSISTFYFEVYPPPGGN